MKPRVFVSSVIEGFEVFRDAARKGITEVGGEPILIEDYPSLTVSPRTACLDGVASCDVCIVVVGQRGGWTASSNKLVVQEEFEEARHRKLPILVFIQNVARDAKADNFVRLLSDYECGLFRTNYNSQEELKAAIIKSLKPLINSFGVPKMDISTIQNKIKETIDLYNEVDLRIVIAPERNYEFIDPVVIETEEFRYLIYALGHSPQIQLFSYEEEKHSEVGINELIILQSKERGSNKLFQHVRLEITTKGVLVIDINVTGQRLNDSDYGILSYMAISEEDILCGLEKAFKFANVFYKEKDPFSRFARLFYNVALHGIENKALVPKLVKEDSMQIPFRNDNIVVAFDKPRLITRDDLENMSLEINAISTMIRRRMKSA